MGSTINLGKYLGSVIVCHFQWTSVGFAPLKSLVLNARDAVGPLGSGPCNLDIQQWQEAWIGKLTTISSNQQNVALQKQRRHVNAMVISFPMFVLFENGPWFVAKLLAPRGMCFQCFNLTHAGLLWA